MIIESFIKHLPHFVVGFLLQFLEITNNKFIEDVTLMRIITVLKW